MNDQIIVVMGMAVQFATGFLAKKVGPDKLKRFIPVVTLVLSLLTQMFASFQSGIPATAAPASYMAAGFFGSFGKGFLDIFVNSVLQTFFVTGAHSAAKNTSQGMRNVK